MTRKGRIPTSSGTLSVLLALAAVSAASPLDALVARLEGAGFLTGSFVQTDRWALTLEEESSSGTLFMAPPNLFLLDYSDPSGKRTGFDGEVLYTVDPSFRQVIVYPEGDPASFAGMLEHFSDTTLVCGVEIEGDSVLVSLSGDLGEGISSMLVGYTVSDSLPWLFGTTDVNGNSTMYTVGGIETVETAPDGFFEMSVPEGFELIYSGDI